MKVPPRSTLWAVRDEVALLMRGAWIERPRLSDETLVRQAFAGLREVTSAVQTGPVCVATDGSVRGKFTGDGWLASTGEYGMQGFWHSTKLIGPKVVLVAELRAIASAEQKLRGRGITVLSDSKLAVAMVKRWMAGEDVLPEGYMAYGADALARLTSRYTLGDSTLDGIEFHRRAQDLAETFAREFNRKRTA